MSGRIDADGPVRVVVETEEFESASFFGESGPPTHVWDCFKELVSVPRVVPPFKGALVLAPAEHSKESEIFFGDEALSAAEWLAAVCEFTSGHPHGEAGILPTDGASVIAKIRFPEREDSRQELMLQVFWGKPDEEAPAKWNFAAYKLGEVSWRHDTLVLRRGDTIAVAA